MAVINYAGVVWVDVNSNLGEDTDPELVVDIAAINNSLLNLLSCPIGSRPFEREYGSELYSALFEPADSQAAGFLDLSIFQAIRRWEPRIQMDLARSSIKPTEEGDGFDVLIAYTIVRTNIKANYQFTIRRL
jgi:phage baseplate assembly protein W